MRLSFKQALRRIWRDRLASAVVIATLALGIGASTLAFVVVDAVVLRPLPYSRADRLVTIGLETPSPNGKTSRSFPGPAELNAWRQATDTVSAVSMFRATSSIVEGPSTERLEVLQVTPEYLSLLGLAPIRGRDFAPSDSVPEAPDVALISFAYWKERLGGDESIVGRQLSVDHRPSLIVGVLPSHFNELFALTVPLRMDVPRPGQPRGTVYGRLRDGVTPSEATERLTARLPVGTEPSTAARPRVRMQALIDVETRGSRDTAFIVLAMVLIVLVISCINVSGLLLASSSARQSEFALASALGASRGRMVGQVLFETTILALAGAAVGLFGAWLSLETVLTNLPMDLPSNSRASLTGAVEVGMLFLSLISVLLAAAAPAWRLARVDATRLMSPDGRQGGAFLRRRGGLRIVTAEVALATVLVLTTGLLVRSMMKLNQVNLGFDPKNLSIVQALPLGATPESYRQFYQDFLNRLRSIPAVQAVGMVDHFPLGSGRAVTVVRGTAGPAQVGAFTVSDGYLETISAVTVAGRLLTADDLRLNSNHVVISESAAKSLFPDGSPVGRPLVRSAGVETEWSVVGVVRDVRHGGPLADPEPQVFFPFNPGPSDVSRSMTMVVRAIAPGTSLLPDLRQLAQSSGAQILVERTRTSEQLYRLHVGTQRKRTAAFILLGTIATGLALAGIFGITSHVASLRRREIAVRIAIGARPHQVVATVVRDSAIAVCAGIALGLGASAFSGGLIKSWLFRTEATEPWTYATVAALLLFAGCAASLLPAIRAVRNDPIQTLRP